jgi:hypothetical protein
MSAPPKAGRELDRRVAKEVFGAKSLDRVPAYSTDAVAADLIIAKLQSPSLRCAIEKVDDKWICVWWGKIVGMSIDKSERLSMSTASTRALAICRSALNLPASRRGGAPPARRA